MKPNEKTRKALTAWQKELEAILAPLIPTEPYPGIVLEPDFRRLVIPSPSLSIVDAAIDAVTDYTIRQELTARARRLEADLTNFDCNKRRFHEECKNMRVAHERQANGTLSDAPEALKQLRRNIKGDIARLKEIISGTATTQQSPVEAVLVGVQAEQLAATNENTEWLKSEEARKKSNRKKVGRENQRNGEKNDNGRKTDEKLKNQIMTEVRQTMKKNKCSQSSACRIVCEKHLKADDKTPIFSKRTIENWMSRANRRKKP